MNQQERASNVEQATNAPRNGAARRRNGKPGRSPRDVQKMLAVAWDRYEAGRVKSAVEMLKRILSAERGHPVATGLLALCYTRQDRRQEAEKLMKRALEAAPMNAEVQAIYGKLLHRRGQLDQAATVYSRALELDPQNGDTYRDMAILLIEAGMLQQAAEAVAIAVRLNPQDAKAFYQFGQIKRMQGHAKEAIDAYSMAVTLKPDYADAHVNLAKIAIENKRYDLGEKSCRKAIEANPKISQAYVNLCVVKRKQGEYDEAIRYGKKAVELDPMCGAAHSNLGNVYIDKHEYRQALVCFREAMKFEPSFAASYLNCGNALRLMYDLDKAAEHYDKAIELDPEHHIFFHNRGLVYFEQGRCEEALAAFRMAVKLSKNEPSMQFSLARTLRYQGLFEESWDYYDGGLAANLRKPNRKFRQPRWRGEDISDKRILVWREQGLGDEIDFSRRYPHIINTAGQVTIEADERMRPIFERSFPGARLLPEKLDGKADWERQDCDVYLPAGNLLQYFPYTEEELALKRYPEDDIEAAFACGDRSRNAEGYLLIDPERVKEMAARVASLPEGFKVGICWRSSLSHRNRDIHYTRLEMWEPIFRIPGLVFINLFYDECEEEIIEAEEQFGIKIHRWPDIDLRNDMEAAFALTTQMDLVMSTASSPSRIAEAVGKEVWLMTAAASRPQQPPTGEYGIPHHIHWQRHWTEPWSALMERMARALEARLKG